MLRKGISKKIAIAGLTACTLLTCMVVSAENAKADNVEATYVAVPMKVFKMLTSKPEKAKEQVFYTYQEGKLVKCKTDYTSKVKKGFRGNRQWQRHEFGKFREKDGKYDNETVLLTVTQLENLKKQKMEQHIQEMNRVKDRSYINDPGAVNATLNGENVKVTVMRPDFSFRGKMQPMMGLEKMMSPMNRPMMKAQGSHGNSQRYYSNMNNTRCMRMHCINSQMMAPPRMMNPMMMHREQNKINHNNCQMRRHCMMNPMMQNPSILPAQGYQNFSPCYMLPYGQQNMLQQMH